MAKKPERTLPFPFNESKQAAINGLPQFDYIVSSKQAVTSTLHYSPQHTNFVNPEYFNPQPVTPNYAQHNYVAILSDHLGAGGGTLDSTLWFQRFDSAVGAQGTEMNSRSGWESRQLLQHPEPRIRPDGMGRNLVTAGVAMGWQTLSEVRRHCDYAE